MCRWDTILVHAWYDFKDLTVKAQHAHKLTDADVQAKDGGSYTTAILGFTTASITRVLIICLRGLSARFPGCVVWMRKV